MEIIEAIRQRHSVRQYYDLAIDLNIIKKLQEEINICNQESGLNIQLITNEVEAFNSLLAHYGQFTNVKNYIALIGKKDNKLDELCGYYGARIALKAQILGLNSCFVALTYKKTKAITISNNEKLVSVIAIGYGTTQGVAHKSKPLDKISNLSNDSPMWFKNGVEAAALAPTALNQQRFKLILDNDKVKAIALKGFCTNIDLGIIKYHFEIGSGKDHTIFI
ncbi:MAG: nitroreductase family protein [Firmicutes bacterium]|nr:nitroreductase family protein [Bacillota bacterium]